MNRLTTPPLMAALSLIMSAYTHTAHAQPVQAQAATSASVKRPIPITSLPLTITTPGYYYLVSNISYTPTSFFNSVAITVNAAAVTIDLNKFSLSGPPQVYIPEMYLNPVAILIQSNNVTVKNGTIIGFYSPVEVRAPLTSPDVPVYLTNIAIDSVTFTGGTFALGLTDINSSIVSNCVFTAPYQPYTSFISDHGSQTGNRYIGDTFSGGNENPIDMDLPVPVVFNIMPKAKGSKN